MLERSSKRVQACLTKAARSRESADLTSDPRLKNFFLNMELSWMRLAASIAFTERVDLFLATVPSTGGRLIRCARCWGPTRLASAYIDEGGETHTFECLLCGLKRVHRVENGTKMVGLTRESAANDDEP